jgi:hypothetical protein
MVLMTVKIVNFPISGRLSKVCMPLANFFTQYTPTIPSKVFPVAIPNEVIRVPEVVMLTKNAPKKIAGITRYPNRSNVAKAIPVGAQIAVALGFTDAKRSPNFPDAIYTTAIILLRRIVSMVAFFKKPD